MRGRVQEERVKQGQTARIAQGVAPGVVGAGLVSVWAASNRLAGMTKTSSRGSLDQGRMLRALGRRLLASPPDALAVSSRTVDPRRRAATVVVPRLVS